MGTIIKIDIFKFALIYVLLLIVLAIMKKSRIDKTKLLMWASFRMTVQLVIAGFILTYIIENPHPAFIITYIVIMIAFATHRVISKNPTINKKFKWAVGLSITFSGLSIIIFFVRIVIGESIFNPQYMIPISGMVMGNAMTGVTLAVKTFMESFNGQKNKIETLFNMGVDPKKVLIPFVNQALETALLPTMNSMLGMGVVTLPGMMTGQILSGTLPTTAIMYQISTLIIVCAVVCLAVFGSLYIGYRTMYNSRNQITINLD